ncbi:SLC13 family permease [Caulobacter flavus]|uniref:SLC13 family permease n=1 Tax=Caulobacter flavus TaxID=1679497 RepID=A0A2N5CRX6_9CAUL|nr:SLC13 family permease [Caulobacter flavus]AYV46418.1 SLC13 family permease [Caulobacter flavus]PLR12715.1 SLC13 family permease [Caulobacter flavus]
MTLQQGLSFALVGATVLCFVWGRWRYDLIAVGALAVGVVSGLIPLKSAFSGFSNDIVIIIASALVLSAAVSRSGIVDTLMAPLLPRLKTARSQAPVLAAITAVLSMATKNVGALALMMPSALRLARNTGVPASRILMPMSFGSLVGGLAVLVGTSPNIIVSEVRQEALGKPFAMFDFMPVGAALTVMAIAYLAFAYRLLPAGRTAAVDIDAALAANAYVTEVEIPDGWSFEQDRVGDLKRAADEAVAVVAILRGRERIASPHVNRKIQPGDVLLLEGQQQALNELIVKARLRLSDASRPVVMDEPTDEVRVVEAVIGAESDLIGKTARGLALNETYGVNLLGVSRAGYRLAGRLATIRMKAGDILVLQGGEQQLPGALQTLGCLPLAEREVRLGGVRHALLPAAILAGAMILVALGVLPVAAGFFAAAVLVVAAGALRMREAYASLEGPVLVLVAAMIPVSDTIQKSGGTDLIAAWLSGAFDGLPPLLTLTAMMAVAMLATPFLNNAATVLIVAPIGLGLAERLGLSPDPFLMAVAVGAGCDFLTPVGHQCNTLVLGPGGYRFGDYARLGAPLSLLILLVAPALIALVWPLAAR